MTSDARSARRLEARWPTTGLAARWPTALALLQVAALVPLIVVLGVRVELAPGVATMAGIYLVAYAVGRPAAAWLGGVLAGVGWLTHGLWDAYHFARNKVVNRPWSEMCAVVDIPVGLTLIVTSLLAT